MGALAISTLLVGLLTLWVGLGALGRPGLLAKLRQLLAAAGLGLVALVLASLLVITRLFEAFSAEALVATVTTRRLSPSAFELVYTPAARPDEPVRVRLQGDQWMISGGVVKWHPWLTALGLKSYHRPLRLSGQFSSVEAQRAHAPTVYALEPNADRLWECLYRLDPYLPFIDAVYGSSAYVYVEAGVIQEIYVTYSGYSIKRTSRKR